METPALQYPEHHLLIPAPRELLLVVVDGARRVQMIGVDGVDHIFMVQSPESTRQ